MKNNKLIFQSKPFWLWLIAAALATVFVPIIEHSSISINYILVCIILLFFIGVFSFRYFKFYSNHFERIYPFRKLFFCGVHKYNYTELFIVEIRKIKAPYQRPYIILHFSQKDLNSLLFSNRAFIYNNIDDIKPLLLFFIENNVKIKINISKEYSKDFKVISEIINKE